MFIFQLPKHEQNKIRKQLENHSKLNGYELEIDSESNEYLAMLGRVCDIQEIFN